MGRGLICHRNPSEDVNARHLSQCALGWEGWVRERSQEHRMTDSDICSCYCRARCHLLRKGPHVSSTSSCQPCAALARFRGPQGLARSSLPMTESPQLMGGLAQSEASWSRQCTALQGASIVHDSPLCLPPGRYQESQHSTEISDMIFNLGRR